MCSARQNSEKQCLTHVEVVARISEFHEGTITVLSQYNKAKDKLVVVCQCGHRWLAQAWTLMHSNGCPICSRKRASDQCRLTHAEVVARISDNFADKITVLGQYRSSAAHLPVRCQCGHQWAPKARTLLGGGGCTRCAAVERGEKRALTQDEFITRITSNFAGKITVLGQYKNAFIRIAVSCQCGHRWSPLAMSLLASHGCANCAESGFQPNKPAITYYARFDFSFGSFYKIGVTNDTVAKRFLAHKVKPVPIEKWSFKIGAKARAMEQTILREYAQYRYRGPDIMPDGNDELFTCDVLGLDRGDQLLLAV